MSASSSGPWHLAPRKALVDAGLAGKAEHPLTQDVAQDLGRAAFDRIRARAEEHPAGVAAARETRFVGPHHLVARVQEPVGAEHVHAQLVDAPVRLRERELAGGAFDPAPTRLPFAPPPPLPSP